MKIKKPFKVGATYQLKKKHVDDFYRTPGIVSSFGNGVFTFTVRALESNGGAYGEHHTSGILAFSSERHMFKRIDNK